ncbi:MAG: hypothetical protein MI757_01285 [Pirellulales bacterium]|nr:hypothetical protein [Pirellulales bacterium]
MSEIIEGHRLDRTSINMSPLIDEPSDVAFWANKTPSERLAAMEYLRVINYGYDPATARLSKVLKISRLGDG